MDDFGDQSNQNATSAREVVEETSRTNRDLIAWSKLSKFSRPGGLNRFIFFGYRASMKFKIEMDNDNDMTRKITCFEMFLRKSKLYFRFTIFFNQKLFFSLKNLRF